MKIIDKIIVRYLLSTDQESKVFFASLLTLMKKTCTKDVPTMAVTIMDGQLHLLYNELFITSIIDKYGVDKLKGVLEHELLHVVYEHLSRLTKYNRIVKIYNLATDMAINQMIDKRIMPDSCPIVTKDGVKWDFDCPTCNGTGKLNGLDCKECAGSGKIDSKLIYPEQFNLPPHKDSEFYYNELLKEVGGLGNTDNNNQSMGQGDDGSPCGTLDDHSEWSKISESSQLSKEIVKNAVRKAYNNSKKLKGTLSGSLSDMIHELLAPPTLNWKQLLRQYIGASIKTGFKSSWKRPNRRFSLSEEFKGKTAKRTIRVLVGIDTSGSVSNTDFKDFMSELKGIMNVYKCSIDMVQCDTTIKKKETLRTYSKLNVKFIGRGGTWFTPVVKLYNESP